MKRLTLLLPFLVSCAWSTFDDLAATTPAHAQEKPDGVKASDYGVELAGVTTATETSGGTLAVLSTGGGNYSTLTFDATGGTSLGDSESLGQHTIDALTPNAVLLTNGAGRSAIVDNSNAGTIIVAHGASTGISVDTQVPNGQPLNAAVFVSDRILVTAAPQMMGGANFFSVNDTSNGVTSCTLTEGASALSAAAMTADATNAYVWSKTGMLYAVPLTLFDTTMPCLIMMAGGVMLDPPANGGHLDVAGSYVIATAFDSAATMTGQVTVVNVTTPTAPVKVGTTPAHGVRSVAVDTFDGMGAVALGYPTRTVDSTSNAGAVDLHAFDLATGTLTTAPTQTLTIPQADQNLTFGRALTTMRYNGKPIVVASGTNVLFAYYATMLYAKR